MVGCVSQRVLDGLALVRLGRFGVVDVTESDGAVERERAVVAGATDMKQSARSLCRASAARCSPAAPSHPGAALDWVTVS